MGGYLFSLGEKLTHFKILALFGRRMKILLMLVRKHEVMDGASIIKRITSGKKHTFHDSVSLGLGCGVCGFEKVWWDFIVIRGNCIVDNKVMAFWE